MNRCQVSIRGAGFPCLGPFFGHPASADLDAIKAHKRSTFGHAAHLFATLSGRRFYTDPGEKFEIFTMVRFHPVKATEPAPN
jgi:hypothetical protein